MYATNGPKNCLSRSDCLEEEFLIDVWDSESVRDWCQKTAVVIPVSNFISSCLSSNNEKRVGSAFAKTKVCAFHLRGMCAHGEHCTYAHDIGQLRTAPDLVKTRMCPRKEYCFNTRCLYAHSRDELRGTEDVYKTSLCRFWSNGRCSAGTNCRHAHGV